MGHSIFQDCNSDNTRCRNPCILGLEPSLCNSLCGRAGLCVWRSEPCCSRSAWPSGHARRSCQILPVSQRCAFHRHWLMRFRALVESVFIQCRRAWSLLFCSRQHCSSLNQVTSAVEIVTFVVSELGRSCDPFVCSKPVSVWLDCYGIDKLSLFLRSRALFLPVGNIYIYITGIRLTCRLVSEPHWWNLMQLQLSGLPRMGTRINTETKCVSSHCSSKLYGWRKLAIRFLDCWWYSAGYW